MGVKGLQGFVENAVPGACVQVDLREMAEQHRRAKPGHVPTLAVDGMACLRLWYSCQAWVHGGQWREYLHLLEEFVASFTAAGIRLVFFFDGVVDDDKRKEWVRRRLRVNKDVARVFQHIKLHGQQPGRDLLCLPSGLATFSTFALKSLGQETWSTTREADYEIASYALQNDCMGILSQDSDFLIFDTAPYLSVSRLRLDRLCTMQLCRDTLCRTLGLHPGDLPLLACVLGNDTVPEQRLQCLRSKCMAEYRSRLSQTPNHGKVFAVAEFISSNRPSSGDAEGIVRLPLSDIDRVLLEEGVRKYLLPGQRSPWVNSDSPSPPLVCEMERFSSADIMQAAKEKHIRAECFIVYNVLYDGVVECSNTLEDEEETDLPPQALLYRPARERLYGLLLPTPAGSSPAPAVKEWFVFPGNQLKEPDLVSPVPLGQPGGNPDLSVLWFGEGATVTSLRVTAFLAIFSLQDFAEDLQQLDTPLMAVGLLLIYISLQDSHLSLEDVDAYLSQAVCMRGKSYTELLSTRVSVVDSRAVQLGSLFVRGLAVLIAANSACGFPFLSDHLMPWNTFDGFLFHSKYLQAHRGSTDGELLEGNDSWVSQFRQLRELVLSVCRRRGKAILSAPRRVAAASWKPMGREDNPTEKRPQHFKYAEQPCPPPQNYRVQSRGPRPDMQECGYGPRSRRPGRQRYRLAPRWPQHPNSRPYFP
ncbi:constitutive coactivator of peroxisome proliferator-activated receptor gamma [Anguilla rostrata]|uniref:constitutive coactivator of peroxisome proliferator-activated receptor gamma n=1 Tax=Anguilla rostrata TaxID=7938 RepID=UPI0030D1C2DB